MNSQSITRNLFRLGILLVLILAACTPAGVPTDAGGDAAPAATDDAPKVVVLDMSQDLTIKPTLMWGYSLSPPSMQIYSRIVNRNKDGQVVPDVAESWEVSDDATLYTFHLRDDITFHDGQPLTAEDVAFSTRLIFTDGIAGGPPLHWGFVKGGAAFTAGEADEIEGMTVIDEYTISYELTEPHAGWLLIAPTELNILPAHVWQDVPIEDLKEDQSPAWWDPNLQIGSGPFKYVGGEREQYVEVAANPDYYRGAPQIDGIIWRVFGTEDAKAIALEKGELHAMLVQDDYKEQVTAMENVMLNEVPRRYIRIFHVNWDRPYFEDVRVRQAIMHAIDRESLCNDLLTGGCVPWNTFMEHDEWVAEGLPNYEYDPEKAKQLLADAGWDEGTEIELAYYYAQPLWNDFMAAIQSQLAEVGIQSRVALYQGAASGEVIEEAKHDLYFQGWGFGDPTAYETMFKCERGHMAAYCNTRVEELFTIARGTTDVEVRGEAYDEIQQLVMEDLHMIPVYRAVSAVAVNNGLEGFGDEGIASLIYPWWMAEHNSHQWELK